VSAAPAGGPERLELLLAARVPVLAVATREERRALARLGEAARAVGLPFFVWTVTEGLRRVDVPQAAQRHNTDPGAVLGHVRASGLRAVYVLCDFHPFLDDPVRVRLLKDVALRFEETGATLVLLGHEVPVPPELEPYTARYELALPDEAERRRIVEEVAREWAAARGGRVRADPRALELLVANLAGLTAPEVRRIARHAVYDDGAVTQEDLPAAMEAKYRLLARDGVLRYVHETAAFAETAGMDGLRRWLAERRAALLGEADAEGLDPPRGVLLIGVQGCGKSLAAKAAAGLLGVPLLGMDLGAVHDKWHGESERRLREALAAAEAMAPCVLWIDELEKGVAADAADGGTARRVLGGLLTWMAERRARVFLVATANDISGLPPELVRKGRFDEVFFVDLPDAGTRRRIFAIHLRRRGLDPRRFDLGALAAESEGFSGAEIEQAVVAARYRAHAEGAEPGQLHLLDALRATRPLSVLMRERVEALRAWARGRTVPVG